MPMAIHCFGVIYDTKCMQTTNILTTHLDCSAIRITELELKIAEYMARMTLYNLRRSGLIISSTAVYTFISWWYWTACFTPFSRWTWCTGRTVPLAWSKRWTHEVRDVAYRCHHAIGFHDGEILHCWNTINETISGMVTEINGSPDPRWKIFASLVFCYPW